MSLKRNDYQQARRFARKAFHRQHGLCFWCKRPMMLGAYGGNGSCDPLTMIADHVQPVWDGGRALPGNIVAACYECNQERGRVTNRTKCGSKFTIGDDRPTSPFEFLRGQLEARAKK
jgi:HNH endonuclease